MAEPKDLNLKLKHLSNLNLFISLNQLHLNLRVKFMKNILKSDKCHLIYIKIRKLLRFENQCLVLNRII